MCLKVVLVIILAVLLVVIVGPRSYEQFCGIRCGDRSVLRVPHQLTHTKRIIPFR